LASYARKIEKREAQLDWRESAAQLERRVRAFNPWPVAYTSWRGETLRIWAAQALTQHAQAAPGSVLATSKQGIDVATGEGIVRLTRVQLPGGRPLSAEEFLSARSLRDARFG
ncbi:MAG: methionyl-tRNA formyltransferase, partial [Gammaproteobacteria bacterium]